MKRVQTNRTPQAKKTKANIFGKISNFVKNHKNPLLVVLIATLIFIPSLLKSLDTSSITNRFCNEISSIDFAKKHTVHIKTPDGTGSGFYIARNLIVTNNHIVEGLTNVMVGLPEGLQVSGKVVSWDNKTDIAIIKVDAENDTFFKWRSGKINTGENIFAIGFPLSSEAAFKGDSTITKGIVSAVRNGLFNKYIQTDTVINPGNSGGPMVDVCGNLIAVSDLSVKTDERSETVFYGIHRDSAKQTVEKLIQNPTSSTPEGTLPSFIEGKPLEVVNNYYAYINYGETRAAYENTFTISRQKKLDINKWKEAFDGVNKILVKDAVIISDQPIKVKATLVVERIDELNNSLEEQVESVWTLKYNLGELRLDDLDTKVVNTKAVYSKTNISNIKEIRSSYEKIYDKILERNLVVYPTSLVNEVKKLISANKADMSEIESKMISGVPFNSEDIERLGKIDERHTRITEIQKKFDSIDWDNYFRAING